MENRNNHVKIGAHAFLVFVALLYLLPLWYVFNNSFKENRYISSNPFFITSESFTLDNIKNAFKLLSYPTSLLNSVVTLVLSCVLLIVCGSLASFGITYANSKSLNSMYTFFVALITVPFQIAMVPLVIMLKNIGLNNSFIGVACIYSAMYLPFVIFLYTGFMRGIPNEMMESANIDGCNALKTYFYIYMPLLKTTTGIILILRGVAIWNDLLVPLIAINSPSMFTLQQKLYTFTASRVGKWDIIFGGTVLVCFPIVILFLLLQKTFIKGVMAGSVKG